MDKKGSMVQYGIKYRSVDDNPARALVMILIKILKASKESGVVMSLNHTPCFSRSWPWSWYIALVDIGKIKKGNEVRGYLEDWHTLVRILKNDIHAEPITEQASECWITCEN